MSLYLVFQPLEDPAAGESTNARLYFGDHPDANEAIRAAAVELNVRNGAKLWAMERPSQLTRAVVTCVRSFEAF